MPCICLCSTHLLQFWCYMSIIWCCFHASYSKTILHHLSGDCLMLLHAYIASVLLWCGSLSPDGPQWLTAQRALHRACETCSCFHLVFIRDCNWLSFSLFHIKATLASAWVSFRVTLHFETTHAHSEWVGTALALIKADI